MQRTTCNKRLRRCAQRLCERCCLPSSHAERPARHDRDSRMRASAGAVRCRRPRPTSCGRIAWTARSKAATFTSAPIGIVGIDPPVHACMAAACARMRALVCREHARRFARKRNTRTRAASVGCAGFPEAGTSTPRRRARSISTCTSNPHTSRPHCEHLERPHRDPISPSCGIRGGAPQRLACRPRCSLLARCTRGRG